MDSFGPHRFRIPRLDDAEHGGAVAHEANEFHAPSTFKKSRDANSGDVATLKSVGLKISFNENSYHSSNRRLPARNRFEHNPSTYDGH